MILLTSQAASKWTDQEVEILWRGAESRELGAGNWTKSCQRIWRMRMWASTKAMKFDITTSKGSPKIVTEIPRCFQHLCSKVTSFNWDWNVFRLDQNQINSVKIKKFELQPHKYFLKIVFSLCPLFVSPASSWDARDSLHYQTKVESNANLTIIPPPADVQFN